MSLFYLFTFGCTGSECGAQAFASPCGGFSCCWAPALGRAPFSSFGAWAVKPRLSSCGAQAYLLHSIWDLRGPGIKPMSPALAGGFFNHWVTKEALPFDILEFLHRIFRKLTKMLKIIGWDLCDNFALLCGQRSLWRKSTVGRWITGKEKEWDFPTSLPCNWGKMEAMLLTDPYRWKLLNSFHWRMAFLEATCWFEEVI